MHLTYVVKRFSVWKLVDSLRMRKDFSNYWNEITVLEIVSITLLPGASQVIGMEKPKWSFPSWIARFGRSKQGATFWIWVGIFDFLFCGGVSFFFFLMGTGWKNCKCLYELFMFGLLYYCCRRKVPKWVSKSLMKLNKLLCDKLVE